MNLFKYLERVQRESGQRLEQEKPEKKMVSKIKPISKIAPITKKPKKTEVQKREKAKREIKSKKDQKNKDGVVEWALNTT